MDSIQRGNHKSETKKLLVETMARDQTLSKKSPAELASLIIAAKKNRSLQTMHHI